MSLMITQKTHTRSPDTNCCMMLTHPSICRKEWTTVVTSNLYPARWHMENCCQKSVRQSINQTNKHQWLQVRKV